VTTHPVGTISRKPVEAVLDVGVWIPCGCLDFVDGEGCFSVAIHGNPHVRRMRGVQIVPNTSGAHSMKC
jgi:hypothetical protein